MTKNKIIDYEIAYGSRFGDVENAVCDLISKGYQPLGSLQVTTTVFCSDGTNDEMEDQYYQAMVKYDD